MSAAIRGRHVGLGTQGATGLGCCRRLCCVALLADPHGNREQASCAPQVPTKPSTATAPMPLQLAAKVVAGGRPPVPLREELPGEDTAQVRAPATPACRAAVAAAAPQRSRILASCTIQHHRRLPHAPQFLSFTCAPRSLPSPGPVPSLQFEGLDAYVSLMRRCWAQDAAERPDFAEVARELRWALGLVVGLALHRRRARAGWPP